MGNVSRQEVARKKTNPTLTLMLHCDMMFLNRNVSQREKQRKVKMFTLFNKMMTNPNDPYVRLFKSEFQSDYHRAIKNGERVDGKFAKTFLKSQGIL
jgi:hypothetical protein